MVKGITSHSVCIRSTTGTLLEYYPEYGWVEDKVKAHPGCAKVDRRRILKRGAYVGGEGGAWKTPRMAVG